MMNDGQLLTKESQAFYEAVKREIEENLRVNGSVKQDILQNIRHYILQVESDGNRPQDVLGKPEKVAGDVKKQLHQQQKRTMLSFIGLFIAWLLIAHALMAMYNEQPLVLLDIQWVLFAVIAPVFVLAVIRVMQQWPDLSSVRKTIMIVYIAIATGLCILFLIVLGQLTVIGEQQIAFTPIFCLIIGLISVIILMRFFRPTKRKQVQSSRG